MKSVMIFLITNILEKPSPIVKFAALILLFASCSKDYYPKQFPPVKSCPDLPVVMYGGEEYPTVLIDNRCWLAKNLNIGIMIDDSLNMSNNDVIEKYCCNNDTANCNIYGGLYQWNEVMQYQSDESCRGICPAGWHIPTNREFIDLFIYIECYIPSLMDYQDSLWKGYFYEGYLGSSNQTGFSAIPDGIIRTSSDNFDYKSILFWSSNEIDYVRAVKFELPLELLSEIAGQFFGKTNSCSIRCIKDE